MHLCCFPPTFLYLSLSISSSLVLPQLLISELLVRYNHASDSKIYSQDGQSWYINTELTFRTSLVPAIPNLVPASLFICHFMLRSSRIRIDFATQYLYGAFHSTDNRSRRAEKARVKDNIYIRSKRRLFGQFSDSPSLIHLKGSADTVSPRGWGGAYPLLYLFPACFSPLKCPLLSHQYQSVNALAEWTIASIYSSSEIGKYTVLWESCPVLVIRSSRSISVVICGVWPPWEFTITQCLESGIYLLCFYCWVPASFTARPGSRFCSLY